ncbi:phage holin [Clostridium sp. HBUAS56017]|uniref:phage holin n=1 Tax=Clostridium sp. HBUAS56017 TaxID=2571128 RepID=UPI001177803E|nr:phage holin [Clostridium sp. HBUAS56017]
MLTIDLKARMKNKAFWVALISAIVLLIQQLGLKDLIPGNYGDIVNSVLTILVMLGVVVDTSTSGISDKKVTLNAKQDDIKVPGPNISTNNTIDVLTQGNKVEDNIEISTPEKTVETTQNTDVDTNTLLKENADLKAKLEQINSALNPVQG